MRYLLPTDQLINRLTPHYLPGRKYILFLQSLVYPLYTLNERFVAFAKEKQIEASMTSQTMYFEWYLNRKFKKYLANIEEDIYISESTSIGVDIYRENVQNAKPFTVWYENEMVAVVRPEEKPREFYFLAEEKVINKVSFMVCVPEITISEREFVYMLSYVVNTCKLAGKTYLIKINSKELEPNRKTNTVQ
ncbi:MAG: hypothetical protein EZS26_001054 [Candidatus Ordinivivax streblomastigis]|uniref:Uncharacterized protein n=1 Tax=Candidatus Ordinivivax streblomastigis TaxID=2540710 RepID=A0A5M8P3B3_9BACT|nr:MAG: hypothetical protein EZS26_001054 [Candidatus Ordinivivax streblomastigis]